MVFNWHLAPNWLHNHSFGLHARKRTWLLITELHVTKYIKLIIALCMLHRQRGAAAAGGGGKRKQETAQGTA
jgi:hypothetical protein